MGYQITWKVKDLPTDITDKLTPRFSKDKDSNKWEKDVKDTRLKLLIKCLNTNKETSDGIISIPIFIGCYKSILEDQWRFHMLQQIKNNEEVWFCGWEYSKNDDYSDYSDTIISDLITTAVCSKDSDPISDSEYFEEKKCKIENLLNDLEEAVESNMNHKFVDEYRDYRIKYDLEDEG